MAKETSLQAGRRRIRISNPDKLLFAADGITKLALAEYYAAVEPAMRTHVDDRPLNVWRWNAGIDKGVVVQQEIPKGVPDWVRRVAVPRRGKGGTVTHAVGGAQVCVALAQFNCVTPHVWTARADDVDKPDRLVFDLDPPDEDAGAHFDVIRKGALALGDLLRELGLRPVRDDLGLARPARRRRRCAAGTTPTPCARGRASSPSCWSSAIRTGSRRRGARRSAAAACSSTSPATPTARPTVAPYAVRALPGAPVAAPLAWEELGDPTCTRAAGRSPRCRTGWRRPATRGRASRAPRRRPAPALDAGELARQRRARCARSSRRAPGRRGARGRVPSKYAPLTPASAGSAISRHVASTPCSSGESGLMPASVTIFVGMYVAGCSAVAVTSAGSSSSARSSVSMIWASLDCA